jgi:hypothetical protein
MLAGCAIAATPAQPTPTVATATPLASSAASPSGPVSPAVCAANRLAARITRWEGAAGSSIGHVDVINQDTAPCVLPSTVRPQLVDSAGLVLIEPAPGPAPSPAASAAPGSTLAAGGLVAVLVRVSNYCGPAPRTPLSIAFVLPAGDRVVASPLSPVDETVPACLGAPGSTGAIEMRQ